MAQLRFKKGTTFLKVKLETKTICVEYYSCKVGYMALKLNCCLISSIFSENFVNENMEIQANMFKCSSSEILQTWKFLALGSLNLKGI